MNEIEALRTIQSFLGFIIFMLGITFIAFMLQFISNVIIIKELPAIKKYTQRIFEKLYNFNQNSEIDEEKNKVEDISIDNNISKENEDIEKQVESLANNSEMPVLMFAFCIITIIITLLIFIINI